MVRVVLLQNAVGLDRQFGSTLVMRVHGREWRTGSKLLSQAEFAEGGFSMMEVGEN